MLPVNRLIRAEGYHELHRYSVENYDFWMDVWEFIGIISSVPPTKVVRHFFPMAYVPGSVLTIRTDTRSRSYQGTTYMVPRC